MINYIINNPYGSIIVFDSKEIKSNKSNIGIIKEMCLDDLFSYDGYIKAIKKKTTIKSLIPILFSNGNIFFPIKKVKEYDNIWINYCSISNYIVKEDEIEMFFESNKLIINISKHKFKRLLHQITIIKQIRTIDD